MVNVLQFSFSLSYTGPKILLYTSLSKMFYYSTCFTKIILSSDTLAYISSSFCSFACSCSSSPCTPPPLDPPLLLSFALFIPLLFSECYKCIDQSPLASDVHVAFCCVIGAISATEQCELCEPLLRYHDSMCIA